MWDGKQVSVVFPAYNEADSIYAAVTNFLSTGVVDEVVVVNNNSSDSTVEEVAKTPARLIHETKQGYGHALMRGLREAAGEFIILAEPDRTFHGKDVIKLLAYSEDFDMVCGTRTTRELIWEGANMGWFLRVGNLMVAKLLQFLFNGPSLSDCGCTLRLIRKSALHTISSMLTVGGSHFLPEMVVLALQKRLRVIEIPVNYFPRSGTSKITGNLKGALTTGLNMIGLILGYRLRFWFKPQH
jgi:glycosyltransferase involved in cell wall biosynthesis